MEFKKILILESLSWLALEQNQGLWQKTAGAIFKDTVENDDDDDDGLYDKLVIQCSFKKRLAKILEKKSMLSGGCEHFDPSLTNSGFCYTFNGVKPSHIWRPSKITEELEENVKKSRTLQNFGGAGSNEGNYLLQKSRVFDYYQRNYLQREK